MCYPKPGPRCSPHAKGYLQKAVTRLESALIAENQKPSASNKERIAKALNNFCEKQSDYDTTAEGIVVLARNYQQTKGTPQEEIYKKRLSYANAKKEQQSLWALEYSQLKKSNRKTSPKLVSVKKRIEALNENISQEKAMYESALNSSREHLSEETTATEHAGHTMESKSWAPTATQQKRESPQGVEGMSTKEVEKLNSEDEEMVSTQKISSQPSSSLDPSLMDATPSKVKIDSFESIDSSRPKRGHVKSSTKSSLHQMNPMKPVHYSHMTQDDMPMNPHKYSHHGRKPEGVLVNMMGNHVSTRVIDTPNGVSWIVQQDDQIRTVKAPQNLSQAGEKLYYKRMGLTQVAA